MLLSCPAQVLVKEQTWARELALGPLLLTGVPILEANSAEVALGSAQFEASLGLAALNRLDFIIDGKQGLAYIRVNKIPPPPYQHNRLGAVFVPRDTQNEDLVASVADASPAFDAGIHNGDILLKIDNLDVTKWRTDPAILPLSRFWMRPAGTEMKLALKRGKDTLNITVTLRQILPPD
jgi:S1-C subfamily serine protease